MKLTNLQEAKVSEKIRISHMLAQAKQMDYTRKMLIKELRQLDLKHSYIDVHGNVVDRNVDIGDFEIDWDNEQNLSIVDQAADAAGYSNFTGKLHNYPGDLSTTMFVKVLAELEKLV